MAERARIGFLINPIAGMGGPAGLKGTDGLLSEALKKGARPLAGERARSCLRLLFPAAEEILFLTASGAMGGDILKELSLYHETLSCVQQPTTREDTLLACRAIADAGAILIIFCGGDGTARDVASAAGELPILGIPAGVKMHSGVFAISPQAAAELAIGFIRSEFLARETEIVDVDEELYRRGELQTRLFAIALTPYKPALVQERKRIYESSNEEHFKDEIALFAEEFMRDGSAYILGAGTTTARIAERLGLEKTLLGVDVIKDGRMILQDASESDLLKLLDAGRSEKMNEKMDVKIIVSPIGAQGFILGRGSQQISPEVLRGIGTDDLMDDLIIVSTPHKLADLPKLLVDTGDPKLDRLISGKRLVVTGYRTAQRKLTAAASEPDGTPAQELQ